MRSPELYFLQLGEVPAIWLILDVVESTVPVVAPAHFDASNYPPIWYHPSIRALYGCRKPVDRPWHAGRCRAAQRQCEVAVLRVG